MSLDLFNDGQRYSIQIHDHFHQKSYVIYVVSILDQCFNQQYKLCFRYKTLKDIHDSLVKQQKLKSFLPDFPKTRSFLFVNRTNRSYKNIQDRARQFQYYIFKLLNNKQLASTNEVKGILTKAKKSFHAQRRNKSQLKNLKENPRKTPSLEKQHFRSSQKNKEFPNIQYL